MTTKRFLIKSESGLQVELSELGARITSIKVPISDENALCTREIALGYATDQEYLEKDIYLGAMIGPVAGRLAKGVVTINGQSYELTKNEKGNTLHGGVDSWHNAKWTGQQPNDTTVIFSNHFPDNTNGFPGDIDVNVTYTIDHDALTVQTTVQSTKDTLINPTNHVYFNLDGIGQTIHAHTMQIDATRFAPLNEQNLPTGQLASVNNTAFDFQQATSFSVGLNSQDEQIKLCNGYDHAFVLDGGVKVISGDGKVTLEMQTDQPAVVIYTYNGGGEGICPHGAFTLETQVLPDAPNHEGFGNIVLKTGDIYTSQTTFVLKG